MNDLDLWRILGNVARGNDPRDPEPPQASPWLSLFPWLAYVKAGAPLALFLLFCFLV